MIHTVQLSTTLTKEEYNLLFTGKCSKDTKKPNNETVCNYSLSNYGIRNVVAYKLEDVPNLFPCTARVNLERLYNNGIFSRILYDIQTRNVDLLSANFCRYMGELLPTKSDLSFWTLKRIDFAVDIDIGEENVSTYIKLLAQGNKPSKMQIAYSENQHKAPNKRYQPFKTSVNYSHGSEALAIYDKYAERKTEQAKYKYLNQSELDDCNGIIRFEVRRENTRYIKLKYNLPQKTLEHILSIPDIDKQYLLKAAERVGGVGDYYRYSEAIKQLDLWSDNYQKKAIEGAKHLIRLVGGQHGCGSVWKAIERYDASGKCTVKTAIRTLGGCGVNPVTLPNSSNITMLPNLYMQVYEKLCY